MFGLGMGELLVILAALLLFVGPQALPGLAKSLGKGVRELRKATSDLKSAALEDEHLGETVRELQSALRGDPSAPPPQVSAARTIGRPSAQASTALAPAAPAPVPADPAPAPAALAPAAPPDPDPKDS